MTMATVQVEQETWDLALTLLQRARHEMHTMQSRVDAILAVDEIVGALCEDDMFGDQYEGLLEEDSKDLGDAIGKVDRFLRRHGPEVAP